MYHIPYTLLNSKAHFVSPASYHQAFSGLLCVSFGKVVKAFEASAKQVSPPTGGTWTAYLGTCGLGLTLGCSKTVFVRL